MIAAKRFGLAEDDLALFGQFQPGYEGAGPGRASFRNTLRLSLRCFGQLRQRLIERPSVGRLRQQSQDPQPGLRDTIEVQPARLLVLPERDGQEDGVGREQACAEDLRLAAGKHVTAELRAGVQPGCLRGRVALRRVVLLFNVRIELKTSDLAVMILSDRTKANLTAGFDKDRRVEAAMKGHSAAYPEVLATSARTRERIEALRAGLTGLAA